MKKTLIVISGGGFSQLENAIGCLKAIAESERVNLNDPYEVTYHGTSAGAIASGMMASGRSPDTAIHMIKKLDEKDLIVRKWFWPIRMWFGDHAIYDRTGLEQFMKNLFGDNEYRNVYVTMTRLSSMTREMVYGRYLTILASTSIQGVFPATTINGIKYIDGGYCDNVPVKDWQLPAFNYVYIILYPDDPDKSRHECTAIGKLLSGLDTKISQEVNEAYETYSDRTHYPNVTVLRPPPIKTSLLSWSDDNKLIDYAYTYSVEKLKSDGVWK